MARRRARHGPPDARLSLERPVQGAIDCDFHPRAPTPRVLARYMDDHWRDTVEVRGIDTWESIAYPANAPLTSRPDWRKAGADTEPVKAAKATLDRFGFAHAICNCLFPVQTFRDENLAAAFARALNDWLAAEWLDKDPRLRGSVVLPIQSAERSVEEIERRAGDPRFVQVLMLAMGEHPLGKSMYWPIYAAAERHGFTVGIHAGSSYHHAVTGSGWPTYYLEDYAAQSLGLPHPARQPHLRGRVRQVPQAQGRADRIGGHLAAALPVAAVQVLARRAQRGALDRPLAGGIRARSRAADDPAV